MCEMPNQQVITFRIIPHRRIHFVTAADANFIVTLPTFRTFSKLRLLPCVHPCDGELRRSIFETISGSRARLLRALRRRFPRITVWLHRAFASSTRLLPLRPGPDLPSSAPRSRSASGTAESDLPRMSTHASFRSRLSTLCLSAAPLLLSVFLLMGCGDSMNQSSNNSSGSTGSAFVIGTDAPVASVVSFNATIQSVDAIDADGTSTSLVSGNPSIDFARYNGLQTLLDMNDVPADTYTQISVTFSSATIGYLQTGSGAPTIQTIPATFVDSN